MLRNNWAPRVSLWQQRFKSRNGCIVICPYDSGISLTEVRACPEGVSPHEYVHVPWPVDSVATSDVEISASWIKESLGRLNASSRDVYILLPTQKVMFECVSMFGLSQCERRSAIQLRVDAMAASRPEMVPADHLDVPGSHCTVVFTMRRETVKQWRDLVSAAGYVLAGISCAELEASGDVSGESGCRVDVIRSDFGLTMVASESGIPWGTRTVLWPECGTDNLMGIVRRETSRLMAGAPQGLTSAAAPEICLEYCSVPTAGCDQGEVESRKSARHEEMHREGLLRGISNRLLSRPLHFNAISTRRLPQRRPAWLQRSSRLLLVAVLSVAIAALWGMVAYRRLVHENRGLHSKEQMMKAEIEKRKSSLETAAYLDEWTDASDCVGCQLAEFLKYLPETSQAFLTQLQLDRHTVGEQTAVRVAGRAVDSDVVVQMQQEINKAQEKYELHPQGIDNAGGDDHFPTAFSFETYLLRSSGR